MLQDSGATTICTKDRLQLSQQLIKVKGGRVYFTSDLTSVKLLVVEKPAALALDCKAQLG